MSPLLLGLFQPFLEVRNEPAWLLRALTTALYQWIWTVRLKHGVFHSFCQRKKEAWVREKENGCRKKWGRNVFKGGKQDEQTENGTQEYNSIVWKGRRKKKCRDPWQCRMNHLIGGQRNCWGLLLLGCLRNVASEFLEDLETLELQKISGNNVLTH